MLSAHPWPSAHLWPSALMHVPFQVKVGDTVVADGVPVLADGYMMVPVQPAGECRVVRLHAKQLHQATHRALCKVQWSFGTLAVWLPMRRWSAGF